MRIWRFILIVICVGILAVTAAGCGGGGGGGGSKSAGLKRQPIFTAARISPR